MVVMASMPWPVQGTIDFARSPRWWGWPVLILLLVALACLGIGVLCVFGLRPEGDLSWWRSLLQWLLAIATAIFAAVTTWIVLQPLLLALVFESLVIRIQREAGATPTPEGLLRGLLSALRVVVSTLPLRAATAAIAFIGPLAAGPAGIVAAATAMSYVALIDACDVGLAARGFDGARRLALIREHQRALRRVLLPTVGLKLLLGLTIVGWLFWLPGLLVGAAREVLTWSAHPTGEGEDEGDDHPPRVTRVSEVLPPT